jgi:putative oxidoreductase
MIKGQTVSAGDTVGLKRYTDAFAPYALAIMRVLVGITFLLTGLPKLANPGGFTGFLTSLGIPLPGFFALIVIALEVGGGLLLIAGLATRWVSLLYIIEMIVTTLLVKLPRLGFIAPQGQPGVGAELDLLLLVCALVLLTHGSGALSVERNILKREL